MTPLFLLLSLAAPLVEAAPPPPGQPIRALAVRPALPPPFPRVLLDEAVSLLMERFDVDKDGRLNDDETRSLRSFAQDLFARKKKAILARYDRDGDGQLNAEEEAALRKDWEKAHPGIGRYALRKEREERRALRLIQIRRFDADGDGQLSEREMAAMRQWIKQQRSRGVGMPPPPPQAETRFPGPAVGEPDRPRVVRARQAATLPPEAGIVLEHLLLERYDTDGDGYLSPQEIEAALARRRTSRAPSPPPPVVSPERKRCESGLDENP